MTTPTDRQITHRVPFEIGKTYSQAFDSWAGHFVTSITVIDVTCTHLTYTAKIEENGIIKGDVKKIRTSPIEFWADGTMSVLVRCGRRTDRVCSIRHENGA